MQQWQEVTLNSYHARRWAHLQCLPIAVTCSYTCNDFAICLFRHVLCLKLVSHSPDFGAKNRRRLLDCVSYGSGKPTRFFWYQILAPVGCVFYFVPISGMHVTTTATGDWSMPLFSFFVYFGHSIVCSVFLLYSKLLNYNELEWLNMPLQQHRRQFLRRPCWFSAPIFSYRITPGTKNRRRFSAPISGVCVISFMRRLRQIVLLLLLRTLKCVDSLQRSP